jgi:L-threo-3-deoxy-hexylosonate aldolase
MLLASAVMESANGYHSEGAVPYGAGRVYRKLYPGVYVPLPTFFNAHGELDTMSIGRHLLNMCSLGMIPVVSGSLGEAVHLDQEERKVLIRTARNVLDANGLADVPIVAGVGGASTRETIRLAKDAIDAGA